MYFWGLFSIQTTVFADTTVSELTKQLVPAILDDHNRCRNDNEVGSPNLQWDNNLADFAKNYAEELRQLNHHNAIEDTKLVHSSSNSRRALPGWKPKPVGENLGYQMNSRWRNTINHANFSQAIRQTINAWCDEVKYYDYAKNSCQSGQMCGHYTQIVWRATTRIGCGVAITDDGMEYFISCNYGPAGNIIGRKPY